MAEAKKPRGRKRADAGSGPGNRKARDDASRSPKDRGRVIAIANQKGGVGKTTSAINIGAGLIKFGKHVLLVDIDPQANLTIGMGVQPHELKATIYEVLKGERKANDVIVKRDNRIDVLPSSIDLAGADLELSGVAGRELLLKEALVDITQDYDYILVDCPPSLGLLTLNALTTAGEVYVPPDFLHFSGN